MDKIKEKLSALYTHVREAHAKAVVYVRENPEKALNVLLGIAAIIGMLVILG